MRRPLFRIIFLVAALGIFIEAKSCDRCETYQYVYMPADCFRGLLCELGEGVDDSFEKASENIRAQYEQVREDIRTDAKRANAEFDNKMYRLILEVDARLDKVEHMRASMSDELGGHMDEGLTRLEGIISRFRFFISMLTSCPYGQFEYDRIDAWKLDSSWLSWFPWHWIPWNTPTVMCRSCKSCPRGHQLKRNTCVGDIDSECERCPKEMWSGSLGLGMCTNCTTCRNDEYAKVECSYLRDRICEKCTKKCPQGYFRSVACTRTENARCEPCSDCSTKSDRHKFGGNRWRTKTACTKTKDAVCTPVIPVTEFQVEMRVRFNDRNQLHVGMNGNSGSGSYTKVHSPTGEQPFSKTQSYAYQTSDWIRWESGWASIDLGKDSDESIARQLSMKFKQTAGWRPEICYISVTLRNKYKGTKKTFYAAGGQSTHAAIFFKGRYRACVWGETAVEGGCWGNRWCEVHTRQHRNSLYGGWTLEFEPG